MVIENPLPYFSEWIRGSGLDWVIAIAVLLALGLAASYLIVALRYGLGRGARITLKALGDAWRGLIRISPRRVWALAWLGVKESIRRRIVVGFAVFIVLLSFAGWFLDPRSSNPAQLYLSFVLTATSYLVLALMLLLSAFSLPADMKNKTLHTVVTKPVEASEVVLGRILGFVVVGTVLLAAMSLMSYVFVVRGVAHTHELPAANLKAPDQALAGAAGEEEGFTEPTRFHPHRHRVRVKHIGPDEVQVRVENEQGHYHSVSATKTGDDWQYTLGNQEGILQAKVPVYGKLSFRDRTGVDTEKGINVGDEWTYRSYIQGASDAAAVWTFTDLRADRYPDTVPVEMNIGVFRTHKGKMTEGVLGVLGLRNPTTGLYVEVKVFESKEFVPLTLEIPRKIKDFSSAQMVQRKFQGQSGPVQLRPEQVDATLAKKDSFDLFEDLVSNGELEVWLKCAVPGQYFGAGQADLYLRSADASFTLNFFKGYLGIWLQMVLVIGFGVMFSTFLSAPVAMIATAGTLLGGFFSDFMSRIGHHEVYGGGPFESMFRLVTQDNVMTELEPGLRTDIMHMADRVAEKFLGSIASIVPPFGDFSYADQLANGFDILWNPYILVPVIRAIGYLLPVFLAGYLFLKTREVAR